MNRHISSADIFESARVMYGDRKNKNREDKIYPSGIKRIYAGIGEKQKAVHTAVNI